MITEDVTSTVMSQLCVWFCRLYLYIEHVPFVFVHE